MSTIAGSGTIGGVRYDMGVQITLPATSGHRVLYGSNPGGWVGLESAQAAFTGMRQVFGDIQVMRLWPNEFRTTWQGGLVPDYVWATGCGVYPNLGSDVAGVNAGRYDAAFRQLVLAAPTDRYVALSMAHEPENDTTPGPWAQAQNRLGGIKADTGRTDVKFLPLLMGATFHPDRYKWTNPLYKWSDWFADVDLSLIDGIGADCYQTGKDAATADHAATVFQPVYDALEQTGLGTVGFGEVGAMFKYGGGALATDARRAEYLREVLAIIEAHADVTDFAAYYESSAGAKGPWCLRTKPGTTTPTFPQAISVWADAISTS